MKKKNNLIFLHKILKAIADSIIKIFIPLYILKTSANLTLSMVYLLAYSFSTLVFMIILQNFLKKYGIISIILHCIPTILCQLVLTFFEMKFSTVIIASILMGLSQTLYSIPLNLIFAFGDKETNVGKFQMATNIGKLIFTLISGFILSGNLKNSFLYLCIISSIFYILCVIPIRFAYSMLKTNYENISKNSQTPKDEYLIKQIKHFNVYHFAFSVFQSTMENCIPLYLYINNLSFETITSVIALIELLKMFANHFANTMVKLNKAFLCCTISFSIFMISIIGLLTLKNPILLYILSCMTSVAFPLTFVPMFKKFCLLIGQYNCIFDEMTYRDIYIFIGKLPIYASFFTFFSLTPCLLFGVFSTSLMYYKQCKIL
ncbi:MAG: MFS transporter, partial [Clostridia bacterium]|nr:MFS transporter [Clostridia bacterium]